LCAENGDTTGDETVCEHFSGFWGECVDVSGTAFITVQSNSLPDHCFTASTAADNTPVATAFEFKVTWNALMTDADHYSASDFDSAAKTEEILCDIERTQASNMPDEITFTSDITDGGADEVWASAAGLGLDAVPLFNGLATGNVDAVENEIGTMDNCL